jgi:hypothetical protein
VHWQGEPAGSGTPRHPSRVLHREPTVFEFGSPISGTYPPIYDHAYWFDGFVTRFDLRGHYRTLVHSVRAYANVLRGDGLVFALALLVLVCLTRRIRSALMRLLSFWWLVVPAAAGVAMYAIIYTELRYIAPFIVLLLVAIVHSATFPSGDGRRVGGTVIAVILVGWFLPALYGGSWTLVRVVPRLWAPPDHSAHQDLRIADELRRVGVRRGDALGYVGSRYRFYWARLAGARVVAEVRQDDLVGPSGVVWAWALHPSERARREQLGGDVDRFWKGDPTRRARALDAFRSAGARVVVSDRVPADVDVTGWLEIPGTGYWVRRID